MDCSILTCPNKVQGNDRPPNISFYEFPSSLVPFNAWIAATGREDFIPNLSSKICSQHFDASSFCKTSGKLKKNAVPTLLLRGECDLKKFTESSELENSIIDPISCILGPNAGSLDTSESNHKTLNIVLSNNQYFQNSSPDPDNIEASNHKENVASKVSATEQELQVISQNIPTAVSISSKEFPKQPAMHSQASGTSEMKPSPCPIKLVDMNKLLEKPPVEIRETTTFIQNSSQKKLEKIKRTPPLSPVRQSNMSLPKPTVSEYNEYPSQSSLVTVSTVLDCLRIILPRSFVLARLKPSEKVAALVIKYLKLDNNKTVENAVKISLKIIIDAAKLEDKEFGDYITHPYHKISDIPLKLALARVFPEQFSLPDLTNEKLKCLCVILSQDIYTDGFSILCEKIKNFSCTEMKSTETITQNTKNNPVSLEKLRTNVHILDNKTPQIPKKECKLIDDNGLQNSFVKDPSTSYINVGESSKRKSKLCPNEGKSDENCQKDTLSRQKKINSKRIKSRDKRARLTSNLKLILKYLVLKKHSATDVINDDNSMIDLCNYLRIRSKSSNLQKLKKMLNFILQKKLNIYTPGMIEATINNVLKDKDNNNENVIEQNASQVLSQSKVFKQVSFVKKKSDDKLKLIPIVVLRNLVDYAKEQMLFMGDNPQRGKRNTSRYHNLRVPHCFTHNNSLQKYSSDYVRKLTNESYREFRKIVIKRDGEKVVFRLHYKTLSLGSSVFVKNFSSPSYGWFKGTVSKVNGPLRYTVKLDDENTWSCVPEQIRPIPETELRTQRHVKPKQLFDL